MYTQIIKQPSVRGIAASALATADVPAKGTHFAAFLRCLTSAGVELTRAQMLADISDIYVDLNGQRIYDVSAKLLLDLQKYYGDADGAGNVDGIIPIYFARPHLSTFAERSLYAIGMNKVDSFVITLKLASSLAQLAYAEVYSEITPEEREVGQHYQIKKYPQSFSSTGLQEVTSIPKQDATVAYGALHIEAGSGTFDYVTVKLGTQNIHDNVCPNLNKVMLQRELRTPQSGYYHVDFARNRDMGSILPMAGVKDFRTQINWKTAAPGNFNIFAEELHGLKVKTA